MNRLAVLVYIASISLPLLHAQTHEGKEFWLSFMEHRDVGENSMVAMITSKYDSEGVIEFPLTSWKSDFTLQANEVRIIQLPSGAETLGSESIRSNGIRVTTEHPSSVFIHQYFGFRSEASIVLPKGSLGNQYYVMSYTGINAGGEEYLSEFLIVATEDSTVIDITPSSRTLRGKQANRNFSIRLDAGETYQVQAASSNEDLTGSYIEGNKDFALFGGNEWTQVPRQCSLRDNLLEQMYPVNTWGRQFVSVPFIHNPFDVFRILASQDETEIIIEYGTKKDTFYLDQGEFAETTISEAALFRANYPVLVAQYIIGINCTSYSIGDPSMVLLNSIEQTRDTLTFYSSRFQAIEENYVNIVVKSADVSTLSLDGQLLLGNEQFFKVGTDPEFSYAKVKVSTGSHTLISTGCGLSAIVYGYGDIESYAYSGGANFNNINPRSLPQIACARDSILLDPGLSPDRYGFNWDLGDGIQTQEPLVKHAYQQPGIYEVTLSIRDDCLDETAEFTQEIVVTPINTLQAGADQLLCEGEEFALSISAFENAEYLWRGPEGYESDTLFPQRKNATPSMSGIYTVNAVIDNCPAIPDSVEITVIPTPQPELGIDTFFCPDEGERIVLDAGAYSSYQWDDQSPLQAIEVDRGGEYTIQVADEWGCLGTDTILIDERCPALLEMPNVFSPNGDQINDIFAPMGEYVLGIDLKIYDRWGKQVHATTELPGQWMGKDPQGNDAPEGVYYWMLEWEGFTQAGEAFRKQQQGTVWLVR